MLRIRCRLAPLLLLLAALAGCTTEAPITGRPQLSLVSASSLTRMGIDEFGKFLQENKESADPAATALVKRTGERIRGAVERYLAERNESWRVEGYAWDFRLIESEEKNAFCMPGGKVAVYTGILPLTKDESGLAVVVAHEIAHAVAGHHAERMSRQLLVTLGGVALQQATKDKAAATRNLFLGLYGAGAGVGFLLPNSRVQEDEADELGLHFMAMAGYDPRAALDFWERMRQDDAGGGSPVFLRTHPTDEHRIARLREHMPAALALYNSSAAAVPYAPPAPAAHAAPRTRETPGTHRTRTEVPAAASTTEEELRRAKEENERLRRALGR